MSTKKKRVFAGIALLVGIAWLCQDDDSGYASYGPPGGGGWSSRGGSPADAWLPRGDRFHGNGFLGTGSNFDSQGSGYINLGDGQSVTVGF